MGICRASVRFPSDLGFIAIASDVRARVIASQIAYMLTGGAGLGVTSGLASTIFPKWSQGVKRRDFLNQTGLILATLGISETGLIDWANRYHQAMAQPARRKLALLIGINHYPPSALAETNLPLQGCLNDIDLQRELLIHRFGFQARDIVTLTNEKATKQAIVQAIIQHLYEQAQPGDGVILHFSGYGSRFRLSSQDDLLTSWVTADSRLPSEDHPAFNDLSEASLTSLLKLIKTKQLTTILDAGFSEIEAPLVGSMRSRSRAAVPMGDTLLEPPALTALFEQSGKPDPPSHFPGLLLRAAPKEDWVVEQSWDDFSAGLFTYAFTQTLWNSLPPASLQIVMGQAREFIYQHVDHQSPQVAGQRQTEADLVYDAPSLLESGCDGVVTHISADGNTADIWLGGLPPSVSQYCLEQSWIRLTKAPSASRVQLRSQTGLRAKAKLPPGSIASWQIGQPVYESLRILPKDISLTIALDNHLERIERVDATSALAVLPFINAVTAEEQPADCLFGKPLLPQGETLTANSDLNTSPQPTKASSVKQGYGLFSLGRTLIPGSLAKHDEAVKAAVNRLVPKLQTLLATKLLRLTDNQRSSQLPVRLNLEMLAPQEKLIYQQEALRPGVSLPKSRLANSLDKQARPLTINQGSQIRYRLFNFGQTPLHFILIALDARERLSVFFPPLANSSPQGTTTDILQRQFTIEPGQSTTAPQSDLPWTIEAAQGSFEAYALFSTTPFTEALTLLSPLAATSSSEKITLGTNALPFVQAILSDIHNGSVDDNVSSQEMYSLSVENWATLTLRARIA